MTSTIRATVLAAAVCGTLAPAATASVTILTSSQDNTLYQSDAGQTSNGAGEWCFAGRTNQGIIRRGLMRFDLSGIPSTATIHSVSLRLSYTLGQPAEYAVALHRATSAWGEGISDALGNEGSGTQATESDATWLHTFYETAFWTTPGGDFGRAASAATVVGPDFGNYVWSGEGLVADVQAWVAEGATNFGWLLKGDETVRFGSAKRFATRENLDPLLRPELTVEWSVFGDLDGNNIVDAADLAIMLGAWGAGGPADLDGDGEVTAADLALLLGAWTS